MVITNGYEDITKGYEDITKGYRRERERSGTIGLDWLGVGWREGRGGGRGMAAGFVFSAWPSPHLSPHLPLPQSLPTPPSTSI